MRFFRYLPAVTKGLRRTPLLLATSYFACVQTSPISFVARGNEMKLIISYTSHHFTPHGRYELNKLTSLPMCGFIAQLVEQRTGNAEVTGSNPIEALIFFFRLLLSNCLNWKIYCDDHSSLSITILYLPFFDFNKPNIEKWYLHN